MRVPQVTCVPESPSLQCGGLFSVAPALQRNNGSTAIARLKQPGDSNEEDLREAHAGSPRQAARSDRYGNDFGSAGIAD